MFEENQVIIELDRRRGWPKTNNKTYNKTGTNRLTPAISPASPWPEASCFDDIRGESRGSQLMDHVVNLSTKSFRTSVKVKQHL